MSSASCAPATVTLRPPLAARPASLLAAVVSDRPEAIVEAARMAGIAADCADAATLWLLPYNAPRILFLDLPVAGVTPRRLSLLVRQLCRAYPDLVIAAHGAPNGQAADLPTDLPADLPVDIEIDTLTDDSLADAFAEARHLLRPVPNARSLFYRQPQKRLSLFH